jgi:hypothetical protein
MHRPQNRRMMVVHFIMEPLGLSSLKEGADIRGTALGEKKKMVVCMSIGYSG